MSGKGAKAAFAHESGCHRWQRVPPNEKRGRVHTSTVTVAVLDEPKESDLQIDPKDIEWQTCRGSGAGGQHRNRTESAVQMTHLPTGFRVRIESERSQHMNREAALRLIRARVYEARQEVQNKERADARRAALDSGRVRTIREQDGQVMDHRTNRQIRFKDYVRGIWDR